MSQTTVTPAAAKKLITVSSLAAITLAFVMVLLFKLIGALMDIPIAGAQDSQAECDEFLHPCDGDMICRLGECVPLQKPTVCQVGDPCSAGCEMAPEMKCSDGQVVRVPFSTHEVCQSPDIIRFLIALAKECRSTTSCSSQDFADLAVRIGHLYTLISEFHDLASVHFPPSKPDKDWPPKAIEEHYVKRLVPHVPAYRSAKMIFLIATASPDGTTAAKREVSYARVQAAQTFMRLAVLKAGGTDEDWAEIRQKIRIAQIGDRLQIDHNAYSSEFSHTTIAWNDKYELQLRALLNQGDKLRNKKDRAWRDRTINQTVFIVPVPCEVEHKVAE